MERIASTALVLFLLAATATAFALTEGLKLVPSPIRGTRVSLKVFSPVCRCDKARVTVSFRLREADGVTVAIVDARGEVVRVLADDVPFPAGPASFTWNGRDAAGNVLRQGSYKPRVHLARQRRTILLPNPIRVDTTPPQVVSAGVRPRVVSPDGDRRADRVVVRWRLSEDARVLLFVNGKRRGLTRFARGQDSIAWYGRVRGKPVRPGRYELELRARDPAGNLGEPVRAGAVTVRYVALGRARIAVAAGARLAVRVSADAARVRWRLAGRTGFARPGTLRLRAPAEPGEYTLYVDANGHAAKAAVVVR